MGKITEKIFEVATSFFDGLIGTISTLWDLSPTFFPAAVGAFIAIVSILAQRKTSREKNSLDFEGSYKRSDTVNDAFDVLVKVYMNKFEVPLAFWGDRENSRTEEAKALRTIFNEWERCANAVKHKIYDDAYLYKIYGSTVLDLDARFGEYIDSCQSWNSRVYNNFKWLALKWRIRRSYEDCKIKKDTREILKKINCLFSELEKINK